MPEPNKKLLNPDKQILYLAHESVELESGNLILIERAYSEAIIDFSTIHSIVCFGKTSIASEIIYELLARKIPLIYFSDTGDFLGRLEPHWDVRRDLLKSMLTLEPDRRLHLTKQMVWGILRQRRRMMQRWQREHQIYLLEEIQKLDWAIQATKLKQTIEEVRGCLGAGTMAYYKGLSQQLPHWHWEGRQAPTPLNQMLSFCYALIEQATLTAIYLSGLDPSLGIWTQSDRSQPLIRDLATEFRFLADAVVLRCIRRQQVSLKDFDGWHVQSSRLPSGVSQVLVHQLNKKMSARFTLPVADRILTNQEAILFQCQQLASYLLGSIQYFCPISAK
jgi:CRISP-associated protein Cas1